MRLRRRIKGAEFRILRVQPGDTIVVMTKDRVSLAVAAQIKNIIEGSGALPAGSRVLVADNGMDFAVIRPEATP